MRCGPFTCASRLALQAHRRFAFSALLLLRLTSPLDVLAAEAGEAERAREERTGNADVVALAAYNVTADRIEDFGFRVSDPPVTFVAVVPIPEAPFINAVLPNTAAAKAGLQPGDRILKSDGRSAASTIFNSEKFFRFMRAKNAEAASGKTSVTWTLAIQPRGTKSREGAAPHGGKLVEQSPRIVTLTLPTPPPHWGASEWQAPEGRPPALVHEAGPMAALSRDVIAHGIWISLDDPFAGALRGNAAAGGMHLDAYEWRLGSMQEVMHRIFVTQLDGRTRVFLDTHSRASHRRVYLTSPSGALEKAWRFSRKEKGEISLDEARPGFEHALDFWTHHVERGAGRWPFAVKPSYDAKAGVAALAAFYGTAVPAIARPLAEDFLKLPRATDAQRALLAEAFGKLGADADRWAYTETTRGLEDKRVLVTRVDPSKPLAERSVLLSIDGRAPKPADVQRWRDDGGDMPKPLGDLPPLVSLVDLEELRVYRDETAATVFEAPLQDGGSEFPREKFQALFRVNKTHRTFEDIAMKLRDSFRVAGVVKVTDAGLEARFQTLDPAFAPQPVLLKAGGGVRVLLVKVSRSFEVTRTDFQRVVPFEESAAAEK